MRVRVLSPIVVDEKQYNRGDEVDVTNLTPLQLASVQVIGEPKEAEPEAHDE